MSDAKKMLKELSYTHLVPKDEQGREMVAVVRCKDCKYCRRALGAEGQVNLFCEQWDNVPINASDYCSYGEKREEAKVMTDKVKLIELLSYFGDGYSEEDRHIVPFTKIVPIVDFLIANGGTVRRWTPVDERYPDLIPCNAGTAHSEAVIVWTTGRKAMIAVWDGIDWLCAADFWEAWGDEVTHWMPLPEPPRERKDDV